MTTQKSQAPSPADVLHVFVAYPRRWIVPAVVVAFGVMIFAVVKSDTWEASQPLLIRNEASAGTEGLGKFRSNEERKAIQETLLEMAKSRNVLTAALVEVGPPAGVAAQGWPTAQDVADLAELVELVPPKGAEFGTTDILYLSVRATDRQRALDLTALISKHLVSQFQKLRGASADSTIEELTKSVVLAQQDSQLATRRLADLEREVGGDLGELRSLLNANSGDSDLRRKVLELENELRQAEIQQRNDEDLLRLLTSAQEDQGRLLATPNRLLESQPALKRLKDGLVDAQLKTAELMGSKAQNHPQILAAKSAQQEISDHLHGELALAIRGVTLDLELISRRVDRLNDQLEQLVDRLEKLASQRAEYSRLVADAEHRIRLQESAEQGLAQANASRASSESASLVKAIDLPDTGPRPVDIGSLPLVALGLVGGLVIGCGVLFLTVPQVMPVTPAMLEQGTEEANAPTSRDTLRMGERVGLSLSKALGRKPAPSRVV